MKHFSLLIIALLSFQTIKPATHTLTHLGTMGAALTGLAGLTYTNYKAAELYEQGKELLADAEAALSTKEATKTRIDKQKQVKNVKAHATTLGAIAATLAPVYLFLARLLVENGAKLLIK